MGARVALLATLLAALALPWALQAMGAEFYLGTASRILVYAVAATSLNLLLGYGGMISLGHAAFFGLGAYSTAILLSEGVRSGLLQLLVLLVVVGAAALVIGAISLRTRGVYFIMITLAFAQMLYFLAISLKTFGGDDGLTINERSDFGLFSLRSNVALYYCAFAVLMASVLGVARLVHSRFGMVLRGGRSNERRMAALGFPMLRYKLTAYVLSALPCVIAGMLLANLTKFAAPSYMAWQASGDLIVMIVLGGMATVLGPVVGALALIILEEILSSWTTHWMIVLGPAIVLIVLTAKRGMYGWLVDREQGRIAA
jgi:branched-chain amino acid transport system permease protein